MNDYSAISDDFSNFQGTDLTTNDGNTIGYATAGSKVGYSAVINPSTGGIDIVTPGGEGVERSFAATELENALNFLTDGDINLSMLDAPLDLLPEYSGGTGTVGLDSEGRLIEYGTEGVNAGLPDASTKFDEFVTADGVVTRDGVALGGGFAEVDADSMDMMTTGDVVLGGGTAAGGDPEANTFVRQRCR